MILHNNKLFLFIRFEYMKYVSGQLVKPALASENWDSETVLGLTKQGDMYLRSCHPLVSAFVKVDTHP